MATKRKPLHRPQRRRVTPELEAKYKRACELYELYYRTCNKTGHCRLLGPNQRCVECEEYFDLNDQIHTALGIMPWQTLPHDCETLDQALDEMTDPLDR